MANANNTNTLPPELDFRPADSLPPLPVQKSSKTGVVVLAIVVALVVSTGLFLWARQQGQESAKLAEAYVLSLQAYPEAYTSAGLPQYPGAQVTNMVQKEATLEKGPIKFELSSADSVEKLGAFYKTELTKLGWQLSSEKTEQNVTTLELTKDKQQLQFTLAPIQEEGSNSLSTTGIVVWQNQS